MAPSTMKVREFRRMLQAFDPADEVTFGSSTFSKSPLIFYRTKVRGEKLLLIELNELYDTENTAQHPDPEHQHRITAGDLLKRLDVPDDWDIGFNCTEDAVRLEFHRMSRVVAIDLTQEGPPEYRRVPS